MSSLFKPFSPTDWDCFAGAEGNAQIGDVKIAGYDCQVVIGDKIIEIYPLLEQEENVCFTLRTQNLSAEQLVAIADVLLPTLGESSLPLKELLPRFGFELN